MNRIIFIFVLLAAIPGFSVAQNGTAVPSTFQGGRNQGGSGPKPYHEVITSKAQTQKGLFTTHKVEDKYYFEIPDSMLHREILVVNRISKAPAGARSGFMGYAGDQIGNQVISFEKGPNNKIFLRTLSFSEMGRDSTEGMYHSVRNSNLQPIVAAFDIKAFSRDSLTGNSGTVIEMTDYFMGDNDILFFSTHVKRMLRLTNYQQNTSYIADVNAYPTNIEISTVKTYLRTPQAPGPTTGPATPAMGGGGTPTTFELNSSMVLLPRVPMKPRYFDPRIGFYSRTYTDFDVNPQGVERIRMVTRWRLEPRPEDVEKYMRGELVEPQKQIVYYIDPATPKKWVPYLIQGVNDWQVAFEKAGFRNAIVGREAPANDPQWRLEDARHSAIVYKPSDIPNASGPHVHDPRSGEILESHINWYHNVMNLLRDWYFIQAAAVDPGARSLVFSDSLMGQLIRFVAAHEVGHTLGLRHNFGSSSTVAVENLRNREWLEKNGHTPSIMDYARFNYVAQPEDSIPQQGLFPRIGDYDIWAIEWGYRWMPEFSTPEEEVPALNRLTMERLKNRRLWFGTETDPNDPRTQSEDLGDNAMKASMYGIRNLQRIIAGLPEWTREENKDYTSLNSMYQQVVSQYSRYMGHVARNIGGIYTTPRMQEEAGVVVEFVPVSMQKEAMKFLQENLFWTPRWLIDNTISSYTGNNKLNTVGSVQNSMLNRIISHNTLNKLARFEAEEKNAYTGHAMLTDLRRGIWSELAQRKPVDIYRRNLQKSYVEAMGRLIRPETSPVTAMPAASQISRTTDAISVAKAQLRMLASEIRTALPAYSDASTRAHLQDILDRISQILDPSK